MKLFQKSEMKFNKNMKKIIMILLLLVVATSCEDKGVSKNRLSGSENALPDELKGLKVYDVSLGEGNWIKVAVINNQVSSLNYQSGKYQKTVLVVNKDSYDERVIEVEEIISETDDIIVIKKKR